MTSGHLAQQVRSASFSKKNMLEAVEGYLVLVVIRVLLVVLWSVVVPSGPMSRSHDVEEEEMALATRRNIRLVPDAAMLVCCSARSCAWC